MQIGSIKGVVRSNRLHSPQDLVNLVEIFNWMKKLNTIILHEYFMLQIKLISMG